MDPTTANFLSQWLTYVLPALAAACIVLSTVTLGLVMLVRYTIRAVTSS